MVKNEKIIYRIDFYLINQKLLNQKNNFDSANFCQEKSRKINNEQRSKAYADGTTTTYTYTPQGTIATRTDARGVLTTYTHDAWGQLLSTVYNTENAFNVPETPFGAVLSITNSISNPISNPYRFSSEYHDDTISLTYYNYRHYNPKDGRWISRDTIGELGGIHLYAIIENKILNAHDYLGMKCKLISGPVINDSAEWKFRSFKIKKSIKVNFVEQINSMDFHWVLDGTVKCCCTSFFFFTQNVTKKIQKEYTSRHIFKPPIFVKNPSTMPLDLPLPSGDKIIDIVSIALAHGIPSIALFSKNDTSIINAQINAKRPTTFESGEWPSDPCN